MTEPARRPLLDLYPNRGLTFVRGEGVHLYTKDGAEYLDLMTNYGVAILGHSHPALTRAIAEQAGRLVSLHGSFGSDLRTKAAVALLGRAGLPGGSVCWTNSGAEANEAALKFAALATGRTGFVACHGGYHGKTLAAQAVTDGARYRTGLGAAVALCRWAPFGDPAAIEAAIGPDTAAVVVEPIQGESGVVVPPAGFLAAVAEVCRRRGVLLIVDEIQTGCGRTGAFTVSAAEGVEPDILCLGKGLAGGIPAGAAIVSAALGGKIERGAQTSTFAGNPLAAALVLAVLAELDEARLGRVARLGEFFRERLRAAVAGTGAEVRGRGLMVGVRTGANRDQVLKTLQRDRILAIPAGADVVRFLPAYLVEEGQLEAAAAAVGRALRAKIALDSP